jgi:hypothetical protein
MPRKQKIYIQAPEDEMKGKGAIPTQELVQHSRAYGGAICSICRHHIDIVDDDDRSRSDIEDKMEGGGYLSKAAEKVEKTTRKSASKVKKAGKKAGKYITDVEGLTSDIVNYGLPAVGSATLGALGSATGNPAVGIAASALGSKLGTMAADKIADETVIQSRYEGGGVKPKRKARFEKGSEAAKEHMRMLREKRLKKLMK